MSVSINRDLFIWSVVFGHFHATAAEDIWPAKPKILIIWPFAEKVC